MSNLNELAATLRLPSEPLRTPMFIDGKDYAGVAGEFVTRKSPGHGVPVTPDERALSSWSFLNQVLFNRAFHALFSNFCP